MEKNYYINIQSFMVQDLKLSGNELLTYAIVYGFSQDGESTFVGSSKYISYALGVSRPTAIKALDSLTAKGLIIKSQEKINDVVFNRYKVSLDVIKNLNRPYKETLQGGYKESLQGGYKESLHSNKYKDINIKNNKEKVSKSAKRISYDEQIEEYSDNEELRQALKAFIQMRNLIKKPLTNYALKLILNNIDKLAKDDAAKIDIINQSVEHSWQGVFPLKEEKTNSNKPTYCTNENKPTDMKPVDYTDYLHDGVFDKEGYDKACAEYKEWADSTRG